jgi:hypothetical protein
MLRESGHDTRPPGHIICSVDLRPGPLHRPSAFGTKRWPLMRDLRRLESSVVRSRLCLSFTWTTWSCKQGEGGWQLLLRGEGLLGPYDWGWASVQNLRGLLSPSPTVAPRKRGSIPMSRSCGPGGEIPESVILARWGWTFAHCTLRRVLTIKRYSHHRWKVSPSPSNAWLPQP